MIGGFVIAWLWWSFSVPRWRLWAVRNGIPPDELHKAAVAVYLQWPKGLFFGKTEFKVAEQAVLVHLNLVNGEYQPDEGLNPIFELEQQLEAAIIEKKRASSMGMKSGRERLYSVDEDGMGQFREQYWLGRLAKK